MAICALLFGGAANGLFKFTWNGRDSMQVTFLDDDGQYLAFILRKILRDIFPDGKANFKALPNELQGHAGRPTRILMAIDKSETLH